MKIGFIGAGKMGFTMGKHLRMYEDCITKNGKQLYQVVGYYSQCIESAKEAARFTDTNYYESLEELVKVCDALILTVPDGQIPVVVDKLQGLGQHMNGKILCHTSGALSSQVFSGMDNICGYSIHPIYAVSSKTESYIKFKESFITIEGHAEYLKYFEDIFKSIGHGVKIITSNDKVKYHSSAVFASNLVIGLYNMATNLLMECGFDCLEAENALKPLFKNNADRLYDTSQVKALTGPVERCDLDTVRKHLDVLFGDYETVYRLLSLNLVDVAANKHSNDDSYRDYNELKDLLQDR